MARWEELPCDLIIAISQRLESYVDHVRLGAICSSWNSAIPKNPTHLFKQIPWLMLPFDDETQTSRGFYSILDDKVYHLEQSETRGKLFRGSCYGWLVILEMSPVLCLFNPLTKFKITLPPLDTFPDIKRYCPDDKDKEYTIINCLHGVTTQWSQAYMREVYIKKLVLSSPPHDDYLAIAIFGEHRCLAFCKRNDNKWTAAETCNRHGFEDVIFYKDEIYALESYGELLISDTTSLPKFSLIEAKIPRLRNYTELNLVGSNNGLMMVERYYIYDDEDDEPDGDESDEVVHYKTSRFKIYLLKSKSGEEMLKWSKITHLGDNVMFLGYNASVLIPSVGVPKLKRNCIYYTDFQMECWEEDYFGGFDFGIFDLGDGRIKEFGELNLNSEYVWTPPLWVVPNP
ncbi:hypothetical protein SLE2022_359110 [Rubroshorea leprosula]